MGGSEVSSTNDESSEDTDAVGRSGTGGKAPRWVWIALALVVAVALVGGAVAFKLGQSTRPLSGGGAGAVEWQGSPQLRDLMSRLCSPGSGILCRAPRFTTEILFSDEGYVFGPGSDLMDVSTIAPGEELASRQYMEEFEQLSAPDDTTEVFVVRASDWLVEAESFSVAQKVIEILGGELSSYSF